MNVLPIIPIIRESDDDLINSYKDFFNHPIRELEKILNITKNMSIISLLYQIEYMYTNTEKINGFKIELNLKPTEIESYEENKTQKENMFNDISSQQKITFKQTKSGVSLPDSEDAAELFSLLPFITYENHLIINKYFKNIEDKKERFSQYRKIIADCDILNFEETISSWEKNKLLMVPENEEAVQFVKIDGDKTFYSIKGSVTLDYINYARLKNNESNVEYYLRTGIAELRKQAVVLLIEDMVYSRGMTLTLSTISLNKKLQVKCKVSYNNANDSEEEKISDKKLSAVLTMLLSKPLGETRYHESLTVPYQERPGGQEKFFQNYNTFVVDRTNLFDDFLKPLVAMIFEYPEKERKILSQCQVKADKEKLKDVVGSMNGKTPSINRI